MASRQIALQRCNRLGGDFETDEPDHAAEVVAGNGVVAQVRRDEAVAKV